jgi:hypothetical protein
LTFPLANCPPSTCGSFTPKETLDFSVFNPGVGSGAVFYGHEDFPSRFVVSTLVPCAEDDVHPDCQIDL